MKISMTLSHQIWPLKIVSKMILSRLPIKYSFWKKFGIFEWGAMDNPTYPIKIFEKHKELVFPDGLPKEFIALELGPGDSIAGGIIAKAHGAKKTYLVDAGRFASENIDFYKNLSESLKEKGLNPIDISKVSSFEEILEINNIIYLTDGLTDLKNIPSEETDFIWSHSVLEHVRKGEFDSTMVELKRILKRSTGRISHSIDLMDHLSKSLNNLRFSEKTWESNFWANSGFYTNRLRSSEILESMTNAGLKILDTQKGRWSAIPIKRSSINPQFKDVSDEDLLVRTMHVLLKDES